MDWSAFGSIITALGLSWVGSPALAGLFWTIVIIVMLSKMGLGAEASLLIGGGFLMVFSIFLLPIEITILIVVVLMILAFVGAMRIMRR
jgi:cytochrome c oxidase subunit IV